MIGFLIRKNFYDLWDNLFRVALINLGFVISLTIPVLGPRLFEALPPLSWAVLVLGVLWCFVYLAGAALSLRSISDYGSFGFADFFASLKAAWPAGLALGVIAFLLVMLALLAIPFYLGLQSLAGVGLAAVIFWTLILSGISFQFFLPLRARLDTHILKICRKCFIIFFDNPGFCLFLVLHQVVFLALSMFLAFLFPGPGGMLLLWDEALRLRLLKYDYLEANPEADRRKIPWDALLIEEREKTGTRSFRNFIFPWKD